MHRGNKPLWQLKIAKERIKILLGLSKEKNNQNLSKKAKKIATRYNIRINTISNEKICKKCNTVLIPGKNATVRTDSKNKCVIIKCQKCNNIYRKPLKRK